MGKKVYNMKIAGLERDLPICKVNDNLSIAAFIMFSDVEITVKCAEELLKKAPEFDYIVTAEAKGIPLAYEMARQSGKKYFVARKGKKLYMTEPVEITVKSITTAAQQKLYMDRTEMDTLKDHKVLVVDDVISTGGSLEALETIVNEAHGNIVGKATVLAEGDAANRDDIFFLEVLPLFES